MSLVCGQEKERGVDRNLLDPFLCKRGGSTKLVAHLATRLHQNDSPFVIIAMKMLRDVRDLAVEGCQILVPSAS